VDMGASPLGGNVAGSEPGSTVVTENGVTIIGAAGLASQMPGAASSMYARNITALLQHLITDGALVVDGDDEITAGRALRPGIRLNRKLTLDDAKVMSFAHFDRTAPGPARFKPGDPVRTKNINPVTHTRLPRYARAKIGTIEAIRGCHVFPDSAATGQGEHPQWLYTVVFSARELWGEDADPRVKVSIEAFEPYLDPA